MQLTLRDSSEERLLARLQTVLERFPVPEAPQTAASSLQAQGKGWCAVHQVQMKLNDKNGRQWWSHKTAEGWCKGRG